MTCYFFGCTSDQAGHYLLSNYGHSKAALGHPPIINYLDGTLTPNGEVEGRAALYHIQGWTFLAWWDNSVDKRPGSNACFCFPGEHNLPKMLELFAKHFPQYRARMTYAIEVP